MSDFTKLDRVIKRQRHHLFHLLFTLVLLVGGAAMTVSSLSG